LGQEVRETGGDQILQAGAVALEERAFAPEPQRGHAFGQETQFARGRRPAMQEEDGVPALPKAKGSAPRITPVTGSRGGSGRSLPIFLLPVPAVGDELFGEVRVGFVHGRADFEQAQVLGLIMPVSTR
jgi:hypothetical protein